MWVELFVKNFNELNESVRMAMDIISDMIADAEEDEKTKRIGFFMQEDETANGNDVAAVAKK